MQATPNKVLEPHKMWSISTITEMVESQGFSYQSKKGNARETNTTHNMADNGRNVGQKTKHRSSKKCASHAQQVHPVKSCCD